METKTNKAVSLLQKGEWKSALSIIKTFRLGFTRDQKRLIEISSDVLNGNEKFYKAIGIDTDKVLAECKELITGRYLVSKS